MTFINKIIDLNKIQKCYPQFYKTFLNSGCFKILIWDIKIYKKISCKFKPGQIVRPRDIINYIELNNI